MIAVMADVSRFMQSRGDAVFSGLDMLVKGALEAGVQTIVVPRLACPASLRVSLEALAKPLAEQGVDVLLLPDAPSACAAWRGAASLRKRALLILDAQGLSSAVCALDGMQGKQKLNAVLAIGPCESAHGTQALHAIRQYGFPTLMPALQMEVKPWVASAFDLSQRAGRPTILALGDELWHGLSSVACYENRYADKHRSAVSAPPVKAGDVRKAVLTYAFDRGINHIINPPAKGETLPLGLVASGVGYARLRQLLTELGLIGRLPILRLGLLSPVDGALIQKHSRGCQRLAIADHRRGRLYEQVRSSLDALEGDEPLQTYPLLQGGDTSIAGLLAGLLPILKAHPAVPREVLEGSLARLSEQVKQASSVKYSLPARRRVAPPGSAILDVAAVLGELRRDLSDAQYMTEQHSADATDLALFGELDAASQQLIELDAPLRFFHQTDSRYAGSAASALGVSSKLRPVVLMGAREFLSQGYAVIADAARAGRELTFIIHTEQPEREAKRKRWRRRRDHQGILDMAGMLQALSARGREAPLITAEIDPADRLRLRRLLERSIMGRGVQVVLARRRYGPRYYQQRVRQLEDEIAQSGFAQSQQHLMLCPQVEALTSSQRLLLGPLGVQYVPDEVSRWQIAASWANADLTMLGALGSPAVGLATVQRTQPQRSRVDVAQLKDLPKLPPPAHARQEVWRAAVAGVAGAGWSSSMRLLIYSAQAMGYLVRASLDPDQVGYGQAALGHILLTSKTTQAGLTVAGSPSRSTRPMYVATPTPGSVDFLFGLELTEAARAIVSPEAGVATPARTSAVIDTEQIASIEGLRHGQPAEGSAMESVVAQATREGQQVVCAYARLSAWLWGHERYKPWMMIGSAMQRGLLPFTRDAVIQATEQVMGSRDPRCAVAFDVGRKLAVDPDYAMTLMDQHSSSLSDLLETLAEDLAQQYAGRSAAADARAVHGIATDLLDTCAPLGEADQRAAVSAVFGCAVWGGRRGGLSYAERYRDAIKAVMQHDSGEHHFELTRKAVHAAWEVMRIPDEIYLASLLTSPARYRKDRRRLNVALERGDSIVYRHVFHPELDLFKRRISFSVGVGERTLGLLSRGRWLRRVRPGWYREHRDLRDRFLQVLTQCDCQATGPDYRRWCEIVTCAKLAERTGPSRRQAILDAGARLDRLLSASAQGLS